VRPDNPNYQLKDSDTSICMYYIYICRHIITSSARLPSSGQNIYLFSAWLKQIHQQTSSQQSSAANHVGRFLGFLGMPKLLHI